jgi:hypothetical protein
MEPGGEQKTRTWGFEKWLASNGKSPAEQAHTGDLRALFGTGTRGEAAAKRVRGLRVQFGKRYEPQASPVPR